MTVVNGNMVHSEHGGNLVNNRVSARLNTIVGSDGLKIVGMDPLVVDEVFAPATLEVDAFGLNLEIGHFIIFDQVGLADAFDFVDDGLGKDFFNQTE